MKKTAIWLACMLFVSAVAQSGCDGSSASDNSKLLILLFRPCDAKPQVVINSTISTPTTWTSDNLYVVASSITVNAQLTIEPGTVVKVQPGFSINVLGSGSIQAVGTSGAHITFTSYYDDRRGCDTDGSDIAAAKGDWGSIFVGGSVSSNFAYCDLFYGGTGDRFIYVASGVTASIDHCTFAYGIGSALNIIAAAKSTTVTNNIFYGNSKPVWMSPDFSIAGSNRFYNPRRRSQTNEYNGIWLANSVAISADRTWGNNGVPYVSGTGFSVGAATLTLDAGTVVKFNTEDASGVSVDLTDADASIVNLDNAFFTSYLDDAHGGDTNNDGDASSPSVGDWDGVYQNSSMSWITSGGILYASH